MNKEKKKKDINIFIKYLKQALLKSDTYKYEIECGSDFIKRMTPHKIDSIKQNNSSTIVIEINGGATDRMWFKKEEIE